MLYIKHKYIEYHFVFFKNRSQAIKIIIKQKEQKKIYLKKKT